MFDTVQETVDRLAASLSRSVALLDPEFLLVSHSRHFGDLDRAQVHLLSERMLDMGQITLIHELRGSQQHAPFLLEGGAIALAEHGRLIYPLRSPRSVLGYLCVTLGRLLGPSEFALMHEAVQVLLHLLERTDQSIIDNNEMIEAEMLTLLSEDPSARAEAAGELVGLGMFPQARSFVALCLHTETEWTNTTGPPPRSLVSRVLFRAITAPMIHSYGFVPTSPEAFVLIGFARDPSREALYLIAQSVERELRVASEDAPITGRLGIGGVSYALDSTWQSYDQAHIATDIARVKGQTHAFWVDEGVVASSLALLASPKERHLTPDLLLRLASAPDETIELFETYFALSGNVARVADRLHMHRSTAYLHLSRAGESLGIDFGDGDSRFLIQAWLLQRRYYSG